MILIFDYFETIIHTKSMNFNRGLKDMWEKHYKDKCSFEEISIYGEELFQYMQELHKQGIEYAFVKDELPKYAERYGGDTYSSDVKGANDAEIDVIWINHKSERNTDNLSVRSISNTSELFDDIQGICMPSLF